MRVFSAITIWFSTALREAKYSVITKFSEVHVINMINCSYEISKIVAFRKVHKLGNVVQPYIYQQLANT
jgi:hypothetical protein